MNNEEENIDINPNKLKPHDIHKSLYEEEEPQYLELVESIQKEGLKNEIITDQNNVIIDGYGRWRSCLYLGIETVRCRVMHFNSERERVLAILSFNSKKKKCFPEHSMK
jgi:ParB-like chromosome segregation protein Spo0J